MGVCLSRCGDAHQQAATVGAAIAHQKSFDSNTESLKKFLHLHANFDANKSFTSPRTSLGESAAIPHSSELFSLPASDPERTSFAISPSAGQASARASLSSLVTSSPKNRDSFSVWSGRFSIDKTGGCRKRIRPARSAGGVASEQELAAHQRLIEAIARLERLNDGKNLGLRGSSFCSSDLERKNSTSQTLPKSRSGEHKRPPGQLTTSRSRRVRHYQLPLQLPKSTMCPKDHHDPTIAFSQPNTTRNLPMIPQIPLEKSVSNFLLEIENFVSLIEVPRLSPSSEAMQKKNAHQEALILASVAEPIPRLTSYRVDDTDSDEMFTFFEASSDDSEVRRRQSPVATSLHRLVQSATQGCHRIEKSPVAEKVVASPASGSGKSRRECKSPPSKLTPVEQSAEQSERVTSALESADPRIEQSMGEEKNDAANPALAEVDMSVVAMMKKSASAKRSPSRMRALKGFRRRLSRSLDSRESAVVIVDFDLFRNGATPIAISRLSNASSSSQHTPEEVSSIDAKSPCSGPDGKLEQAGCDQKAEENYIEVLNAAELASSENLPPQQLSLDVDQIATTSAESCLGERVSLDKNPESTTELAALELPSLQIFLVEDQSPSTSAESSFREPDNLESILECPETNRRSEETLALESTDCTESASPSLSSLSPTETRQADFHPIPGIHSEVGDSQTFLSRAFNSLLKLLLVTEREQTGSECAAIPNQDEEKKGIP